jgi:RNA methyltransferase, TrmH family
MAHPASPTPRHVHKAHMVVITGRENRWLKRFRLALGGDRDEDGNVGVEGVRLVEAALGSGLPVEALLVSESGVRHLSRVSSVLASAVPVFRTADKLFAGVADTQSPQGIAALVRPRQATLVNLCSGKALIVALAGLQDPGNVGTIVRAAEAFGATGAVTCATDGIGTSDPYGPKAMRASAGSALRFPIVHGIAFETLLSQLRRSGVKVYAAVAALPEGTRISDFSIPTEASLPWDVSWKDPSAILIGNEGSGLPAGMVRAADARVYIPQAGSTTAVGIESLNAAMAASVLLYEAMRQRNAGGKVNS